MRNPAKRRRRLARWAVLWLAVLNFLLWTAYSRSSRSHLTSPAAGIQSVASDKA